MKFHKYQKVVFLKRSDEINSLPLTNYEEYLITLTAFQHDFNSAIALTRYFYGVSKNGVESTWYPEVDFLTLKEYENLKRKLKLKKLNEISRK